MRGTAVEGEDYETVGKYVTIPAGEPATTLTVKPTREMPKAGCKTVLVTLERGNDYILGPDFHAQVTIANPS